MQIDCFLHPSSAPSLSFLETHSDTDTHTHIHLTLWDALAKNGTVWCGKFWLLRKHQSYSSWEPGSCNTSQMKPNALLYIKPIVCLLMWSECCCSFWTKTEMLDPAYEDNWMDLMECKRATLCVYALVFVAFWNCIYILFRNIAVCKHLQSAVL